MTRSMIVVAAIAVVVCGGVLAYAWYDARSLQRRDEMTPDEAASWAAKEAADEADLLAATEGLDACLAEGARRWRRCWPWQMRCQLVAMSYVGACVGRFEEAEEKCVGVPVDPAQAKAFVAERGSRHHLREDDAERTYGYLFNICFLREQARAARRSIADGGDGDGDGGDDPFVRAFGQREPPLVVQIAVVGRREDVRAVRQRRALVQACVDGEEGARPPPASARIRLHLAASGGVTWDPVDAAPSETTECQLRRIASTPFDPGDARDVEVTVTTKPAW